LSFDLDQFLLLIFDVIFGHFFGDFDYRRQQKIRSHSLPVVFANALETLIIYVAVWNICRVYPKVQA